MKNIGTERGGVARKTVVKMGVKKRMNKKVVPKSK